MPVDNSNSQLPPDAATLLSAAAVDLREGRTRIALATVRRALEVGFVDAGAHLHGARLLRELGEHDAAIAALQRSVALAPARDDGLAQMQQWGLLGVAPPGADATVGARLTRTPAFDLTSAARALCTDGIVVMKRFVPAVECEALRRRGDDDAGFVLAQALATERGTASRAVWREPLAPEVLALAAEAYCRAVEISNDLRATLRVAERFPTIEPRPLSLWDRAVRLALSGGAGHPARRDPGDRQSFPLRGVVALGPAPLEVVLHDLRPGKPRMRRGKVGVGSLALYCARERPVAIGGVLGLQAIEWELTVPDAGVAGALLLAWPHAVSAPA